MNLSGSLVTDKKSHVFLL